MDTASRRIYGNKFQFSIRLVPEQVAALDAFAARKRLTRSIAIAQLIDAGLEHAAKLDRLAELVAV